MRTFLLLMLMSGYAFADGHARADNEQLEAAIGDTVAAVVEEDMDAHEDVVFVAALSNDDDEIIDVTKLRAPIVTVVEINHP
ncbi:MAG: hypothetical protein AAGE43_06190 [Pseudomonadota bacterium]